MTKLEKRLTAAVVILAMLLLILAIALGSLLEGQGWYNERISSLQSEVEMLQNG